MIVWRRLADMVASHGGAALVGVHAVKGSAPRERGARMIVRPDGAFSGTIGGGQLEWQALAAARDALAAGRPPARFTDLVLGPDLGQCCGGRVTLLIEVFDGTDAALLEGLAGAEAGGVLDVACSLDERGRVRRRIAAKDRGAKEWSESYGGRLQPLLLFGAGHVGRALVLALAPLPFTVRWTDSRDGAFPQHIPGNVEPVLSSEPEIELVGAPSSAFVLVMTHEHPLDLSITAAALKGPFPFVGLIGSATKRARFERRFREIGIGEERIASLVCPIGLAGITGKEPSVIAASVAAQLLKAAERPDAAVAPAPARDVERRRHDEPLPS
jgi:xanthine dehydrogenase accessory factor